MSPVGVGPELTIGPRETGFDAALPLSSPSLSPNNPFGVPAGTPDFGDILKQQVVDANKLQQLATAKAEALAKGAADDLHGTMITVKEAEISMKLVGTVRNRLLDAFHELWRINL